MDRVLPRRFEPGVVRRADGLSVGSDARPSEGSASLLCISFFASAVRIDGMDKPHAVVIGASAGGVSALLELAAAMPADFPALVGVVLHVGDRQSILPQLMSARGPLPAVHPESGDALKAGRIYVAPPDHHMQFTPHGVQLLRGPRENHARPAIDPLFRSAAMHWRDRAIGVVLTGELDDGTAGLAAIKECGGTAIVQDPATATERSMPASALANVAVDECLPLSDIVPALRRRVQRPHEAAPAAPTVPGRLLHEQAVFEGRNPMENLQAMAAPSTLTCPDCGGSLWEMRDTRPLRYRCHTGHAFTAGSLENQQVQVAEQAMWSSVRSLQEREALLRRLAGVARSTGDDAQAQAGLHEAERVRAQVQALVALIEGERASA